MLPLQNLTGDPEQNYLCDGLTEELIAQLGGARSQRLFGDRSNVSHALQEHNEASGRHRAGVWASGICWRRASDASANGVRITAQLVATKTEGHVWVEQYEREVERRPGLAAARSPTPWCAARPPVLA